MKNTGKNEEAATGGVLWKKLILKILQHYKNDFEILKFYHWDIMGISPFSFSWFFITVFLLDYRLFYAISAMQCYDKIIAMLQLDCRLSLDD